MKFFRSHGGAVLVTILVIALSILFGAHRSLTAAKADVEAVFYNGVDGSGHSIQNDLQDCMTIAENLQVVAGRYLTDADTELSALTGAITQLQEAAGPGEKFAASRVLGERAETLMKRLDSVRMAKKDLGYLQGFRVDLASIRDTMSRDSYNALADEFNAKVLGVFPANLIHKIALVTPAEPFR